MNIFLSLFSGVLTGLSFNFSAVSWLIWFSLSPFLIVLSRNPGKRGFLYSFIFGAAYYSIVLFWIRFVTGLGLSALIAYMALYCGVFAFIARNFFNRPLSILTIPAVWVLIEFLKEHIWIGFGWGNLGYSQFRQLWLAQIADCAGTKGISFVIVMINVCLWQMWSAKKVLWRSIILSAVILIFCAGYSMFRLNTLAFSREVKISLIQPNVSEKNKLMDSYKPLIVKRMIELAAVTDQQSLLIFPEAAWPFVMANADQEFLSDFVKKINRDALIGAVEFTDGEFHNSAFLLTKDGNLQSKYQKNKIVPFGEYIPLRKLLNFIPVINEIGDMSPGKQQAVFAYDDKKFSTLICFEDVFANFVSQSCKDKDFLINITNDGWFYGQPQADQHLGIMVMRAIENRISIARCANTGISGYVDYAGHLRILRIGGREVMVEGTGMFTMPLNNQRSIFNIIGDFFSVLCAGFLLIFSRIRPNIGRLK